MKRYEAERLIKEQYCKHYVYILKDDDGKPFYVGLGRGTRIFQHEEEALAGKADSAKLTRIREILSSGSQIDYEIDSFHDETPWNREEALIGHLGRCYKLTNAQRYEPASETDGVVLRKYAGAYDAGQDVTEIPPNFPYIHTKLTVGPNQPGPRAKVYGRICEVLKRNPGITGESLIAKLHQVDWSDVRSAYTEGRSKVSGKWLADYVKGGFYKKNQFIQELQ